MTRRRPLACLRFLVGLLLLFALAFGSARPGAAQQVINGCRIEPDTACPGADLRNADLRGVDLTGANLAGADLQGANLEEADFDGANLQGADFTLANLTDAKLDGADLRDAILTDANLEGVSYNRTTCPNGAVTNGPSC
jgi:uncharacterized protein YjbI with pentapeptide repeats